MSVKTDRAYLVKRWSESHKTKSWNSAVCWLDTCYAAESSRLSDRSACISTKSNRCKSRSDSRSRSAWWAARYTVKIIRILCLCKSGGLCRTSHCELVHRSLAEHYDILSVELFHNGRIIRRNKVFKHFWRTGGLYALCTNIVLYCHRYSCESLCFALIDNALSLFSLLQSLFFCNSDKALYLIVIFLYSLKICLCKLFSGNFLTVKSLTHITDFHWRNVQISHYLPVKFTLRP